MSILVLTSDTLIGTPATGNIEYNGQFFGTDSNASRAQLQRIVLSTTVASTSGTSIDFTGIPAWVKKITVMFNVVSTNGASDYLVQIGSGSPTTSGYAGSSSVITTGVGTRNFTTGFGIYNNIAAGTIFSGAMTIMTMGSNLWVSSGAFGMSGSIGTMPTGGSVTLGGTLDRVRITTVNGTDAYDAGSVNIMCEG
jgi:hypothetical protein